MLTVVNVAYALATVGPNAIGGSEQVLSEIDRALVEHGHRSVVVAPLGSQCFGTLYATAGLPSPLDAVARARAVDETRRVLRRALSELDVDLVHLHGLEFYEYVRDVDVPVLVTLHLPFRCYVPEALVSAPAHVRFHCVSESQRRTAPPHLALLPTIENGVRIPRERPDWFKRDYVVALGRICPEKGFHLALEAAHRTGAELVIGGRLFEYSEHVEYFKRELLPRLDDARRFIGPVHGEDKLRLLAEAACVVVPSLIDETSSLVAMEALASGTPVVAFRRGALPEIVRDGKTGFLVSDVDEMAKAIQRVRDGAIDPQACRRVARERFSIGRTVARYLNNYAAMTRTTQARWSVV